MAQFNYLNEINSLATMDGPITRGPLQRWAKKGNSENINPSNSYKSVSNINLSCNQSMQKLSISNQSCNNSVLNSNKTPTRNETKKGKKTPSKNKSPGRSTTPTPSKASKTPNKADRFIPSRSNSNYDLCHYMMNREEDKGEEVVALAAASEALGRALNDTEPGRLLQYTCKAPAAPEGYQNRLRVVYSQAKVPSTIKSNTRYIPQAPDRILDAPEILDDYYLNLVDWSASNILAVALGNTVYLWNAGTGQIEQLMSLEGADTITSVAWVQGGGSHLAIGTSLATVELWDCERIKRLRVMEGHSGRVGSLAWNMYILSSGARDGNILHHDVRQREHVVSSVNAHTQEICGLKWSPDGKYLASGGNDNLLNIWPQAQGNHYSGSHPIYSFNQHLAAVKGLSWCPWNASILASGGGTADRTLRLWNVSTGANINTVDTKSQVCSILWSTHYRELISGHGYVNNQLIIWKFPTLSRVAELSGHTARVLHMAMSPDGSTVLSAGADETLRLWKCFMLDPSKKKETSDGRAAKSLLSFNQFMR